MEICAGQWGRLLTRGYTDPLASRPPSIALALPDHGFRLDGGNRFPPALPDELQGNCDRTVTVLRRRMFATIAQQSKLMAAGDVLDEKRFA
jgi:hypothetical protein